MYMIAKESGLNTCIATYPLKVAIPRHRIFSIYPSNRSLHNTPIVPPPHDRGPRGSPKNLILLLPPLRIINAVDPALRLNGYAAVLGMYVVAPFLACSWLRLEGMVLFNLLQVYIRRVCY
jgi:hypothetical protein